MSEDKKKPEVVIISNSFEEDTINKITNPIKTEKPESQGIKNDNKKKPEGVIISNSALNARITKPPEEDKKKP